MKGEMYMESEQETAARKRQIDMFHGPLWNKIPLFALPVAATAILEQLFNASDLAIVGNFAKKELQTAAVAAVGANSPVIGLIVNLFIGVALGTNVVIANAVGCKNKDKIQKAVHTSVTVAFFGGIFVAVLGEIIASPLLKLLLVPKDVFDPALLYLRIYLLGMPVILLYNFEAAVFRSVGETKTPLIALAISGALNVMLNLFFVAALHMTVDGVAIATVISNAVSSLILCQKLRKSASDIRLDIKKLGIDAEVLKQILKIGVPAGIQSAVFSISNIVIQSAINSLGKVVMAASSAAFNIEIITYDILNSFSQACTTFVGQNYGSGNLKRCRRVLALCILEAAVLMTAAIVTILFFGKHLLSLFNDDPEVISIGFVRLAVIMPAHLFSMVYETLSGYLRGFGISLVPAVLTIFGVCGVRIAWINLVFPRSANFGTIMTVYPISLGITAIFMLCAALYYRPSRKLSADNA